MIPDLLLEVCIPLQICGRAELHFALSEFVQGAKDFNHGSLQLLSPLIVLNRQSGLDVTSSLGKLRLKSLYLGLQQPCLFLNLKP